MYFRSDASARKLNEYRTAFRSSLTACEEIWGDKAFRRFERGQWRDQMLGGMYDAQMIAVDTFDDAEKATLARRATRVLASTQELFNDPAFETAVRTSTNTPSRLSYRTQQMITLLSEVLA